MIVSPSMHPRSFALLQRLAATTPPKQSVFGSLSLMQYQTLFKWFCAALSVKDYSPHSPRAGFASEGFLSHKSFTDLREEGRWTSDSSLRIYLDVIATASALATEDARRQVTTLRYLDDYFYGVFRWWPGCPPQIQVPLPASLSATLFRAMRDWPVPMMQGHSARCLRD